MTTRYRLYRMMGYSVIASTIWAVRLMDDTSQ
jgi:hypothetical protein